MKSEHKSMANLRIGKIVQTEIGADKWIVEDINMESIKDVDRQEERSKNKIRV